MWFFTMISMASGVSVFIFGLLIMKHMLESSFKEKLSFMMKKFTKNRFSGVLTGIAVTVGLQSSSASSVLCAALVDSGILSVQKAFWIIVGANIGTTFTGLLTAYSFADTAPVFALLGIVFISVAKNKKYRHMGLFFMGFGLLFVGMRLMTEASEGIKDMPILYEMLILCKSPVAGILTGCLFTAVIQSSSVVTALLQSLGQQGIIGINQAFYIILGSNIGTCATCAIASIGLKNGAKKVSLMHIFYNFFGAVLFFFVAEIWPLPILTETYFPGNIKTQIAAVNIFFNVSCGILALLLPIKEKKDEKMYFPAYLHLFSRVLR